MLAGALVARPAVTAIVLYGVRLIRNAADFLAAPSDTVVGAVSVAPGNGCVEAEDKLRHLGAVALNVRLLGLGLLDEAAMISSCCAALAASITMLTTAITMLTTASTEMAFPAIRLPLSIATGAIRITIIAASAIAVVPSTPRIRLPDSRISIDNNNTIISISP